MNRYNAREHAFSVIFSAAFQNEMGVEEAIDLYTEAENVEKDDFFCALVKTTYEHLSELDAEIEEHLNNWSLKRVSKVSLAVLRLGLCEIRYFKDTPRAVSINEAVELAKKYEGKECGQFVNGVLSAASE